MVRHMILHQSLDLGQRTGSAAAQMLAATAAAVAAMDSVRRRLQPFSERVADSRAEAICFAG